MTRSLVRLALVCAAALVSALPAAAQERRFGVLVGYPASVGVQWDVFDRFGVRVDGTYNRQTFETTIDYSRALPPPGSRRLPRTTTSTFDYASLGVSALFTVQPANPVKLYVASGVGVVRETRPTPIASISLYFVSEDGVVMGDERNVGVAPETETEYRLDLSARFGASYRLGDRFSVFGETGVGYDRGPLSEPDSRLTVTSLGLRASVGGILYF